MASGLTLAVRQIGSYPLAGAGGGDLLLMQPGGLGNPYASVDAATLVSGALVAGPALGVGIPIPPGAAGAQIFTGNHVLQPAYGIGFNTYLDGSGNRNLAGGFCGTFDLDGPNGAMRWTLGSGGADQPSVLAVQMLLSQAGALSLPNGTLTVARDPGAALEVATMGWVGANTVTSFNGRQGAVTLNGCDIYSALCLDSLIATENWVNANIQASIQMLLANHPFVFGWNGRTGAVYLTLADISCVFFQPGQQPITPTPPAASDDYSIANTQWVTNYVQSEFAGTGGLATQDWVLANTVNTFNGRYGVVSLTTADITGAGGAPINSPQFTGVPQAPTAAPGQANGQLATTLFVQQAIIQNTTGVVSFNTRTGAIVLDAADINDAGGALLASPNFSGTPTAPTAPVGTNDTQLATTAFVLQEVSAIGAGVLSFNGRSGVVTLTLGDIEGAGGAPLASPAFTGNPTVPTPASPVAATTSIANTNWVVQYNALNTVASFNGRIGAVTLSTADVEGAGGLANPSVALTGTPTAPTQAPTDNSTAIATTAYVRAALTNFGGVLSFNTRTGAVTLTAADLTAAGGALLASPTFTGTPAGPTAAPGTSTTQLATTAFVLAAIAASGVSSFNGRTGAVTLSLADITAAGGAPLANPGFSGVPTAPTAPPGTSTTQLATCAFVQSATAGFLPLSGGTLTGELFANGSPISISAAGAINGPSATLGGVALSGNNITATGTLGIGAVNASGATMATTFNATAANGGITFAGGGGSYIIGGAPGTGPGSINLISPGSPPLVTFGSTSGPAELVINPVLGIAYTAATGAGAGQAAIAFLWGSPNLGVYANGGWVGNLAPSLSDPRLKSNIAPLSVDCLAVVNQMTLQQFDLTLPMPAGMTAVPRHFTAGFMADELVTLIPEAVSQGDGTRTFDSLDLLPIVAYLVGAVQQLSAEVSALKAVPA